MQIRLKLSNYRCFPDSSPAEITLEEGFTSFIGINNSGKSALLKFFYEFRSLFSILTNPGNIRRSLESLNNFDYPEQIRDDLELFNNKSPGDLIIEMTIKSIDEFNTKEEIPLKIKITIPFGSRKFRSEISINGTILNQRYIMAQNLMCTHPFQVSLLPLTKAFKEMEDTIYIGPFRNAINEGSNSHYYDLEIGEAFIRKWKNIKEGSDKRQNEAALEIEDEIRKIFEFDQLQINPSEDCKTLSIMIDRKSYTLSELGAGLAQFIVVLAMTSIRKPKYILIDEPELHLHPSLQLDFLTTLGSYAQNGGVLFATHSTGLARSSSDNIYAVHKISHGKSSVNKLDDHVPLPSFLGELSYSGYKEFGLDTILLVEGTHDVKVFQQFLRLYGCEHKIVIVPLGGASLVSSTTKEQLEEITRLSSNIYAVIDSEKTSEGDEIAERIRIFEQNCKGVGITCHILERRATENYFTDLAIKKVKSQKYNELTPFQLLKEVSPSWGKHENWLIARQMTKEDLEGTDLEKFLEELPK